MAQIKHTRSIASQRRATAPYNFVALPNPDEMLICVSGRDIQDANAANNLHTLLDKKLPRHDQYDDKLKSGYFEIDLETLSPLFIRGMLSEDESRRAESDQSILFRERIKNKPDFFYTDPVTKRPVIPGSSLRGMLRSVVEIISFGKLGAVQQSQLFYRDPSNRDSYQNKMTERDTHNGQMAFRALSKTGRLRKTNRGWQIEECKSVRIHLADVARAFDLPHSSRMYLIKGKPVQHDDERNPNQYPSPEYQHREVWVNEVSDGEWQDHSGMFLYYATAGDISAEHRDNYQKGQLLLTGPMQKKSRAFVFLEHNPDHDGRFDVPTELVESLNDPAQLTDWQESAFGASDGRFIDGSLVLFLHRGRTVSALGRAQLFRIGYDNRVTDLLPPIMQNPAVIDFAEAMPRVLG